MNSPRQWLLWHTVNSSHYCLSGCICLHLPGLFPPVTFPLHLSLRATVEMNENPFDRACLELQCPPVKFITLRGERIKKKEEEKLRAHFHELPLAGSIPPPALCCVSDINRKCQSTLQMRCEAARTEPSTKFQLSRVSECIPRYSDRA